MWQIASFVDLCQGLNTILTPFNTIFACFGDWKISRLVVKEFYKQPLVIFPND